MTENEKDNSPPATTYRTVELAIAALLFAIGCVLIADSLRLGASWGDDGPQAGYFPFYVGLAICISTAWTFFSVWRNPTAGRATFVTHAQLRRILAMLVPAVVYAVAIALLGIYVSSALFLAYFMARHGGHRLWVVAAVSIGMPVALFLMFEIWFRTPLTKGPLEALLRLV
jgi:putative tricarboxylic transport membrane protein